MAKRKRIALIYAYNENWIGGTYYIENLIAALNLLSDDNKPELLIFSWKASDAERLQQAVKYPYWSFRRFERTLSFPARVVNKLTAMMMNRRFINTLYSDIDLVFPLPTMWRQYFSHVPHHLYWIPDFQEHYLSAFFSIEELDKRKLDQQLVLKLAKHIVFSSHAAQNDFNTIYPHNNLVQHILQFAVTSRLKYEQRVPCLVKYSIDRPYFICSNQFWMHKNHSAVLKALAELRHTFPHVLVVFTGKEYDYRNSNYFDDLMALRKELDLDEEVKFLGFIPREDQLTLMQSSIAVIQPSHFEGWSTVVEDAKSLAVPIIASALSVHEEQLASYEAKLYFSPEDPFQLAVCMAQSLNGELPSQPYAYSHDVKRFAQEFINIVHRIIK